MKRQFFGEPHGITALCALPGQGARVLISSAVPSNLLSQVSITLQRRAARQGALPLALFFGSARSIFKHHHHAAEAENSSLSRLQTSSPHQLCPSTLTVGI